MKTKILITLILLVLFGQSCRKVLNISIEEKERMLVVNGILNPDSVIRINVSKSISVLEDLDTLFLLRNAVVEVYENDQFKEKLSYSKYGTYKSTFVPQQDKKYKIVVSHPQIKQNAEVEVEFLDTVAINSLSYDEIYTDTKYPVFDQWGNPAGDTTIKTLTGIILKVNITDPANVDNYYLLSVSRKMILQTIFNPQTNKEDTIWGQSSVNYLIKGIETSYQDADMGINEPIRLPVFYLKSGYFGKVFGDTWFKNSNYTIKAEINQYDFGGIYYKNDGLDTVITLTVKLFSVSKDVYYFATSYEKYIQAYGTPFAEPVNIFSNVKNGFGFVAAVNGSEKRIDVRVPRYPYYPMKK